MVQRCEARPVPKDRDNGYEPLEISKELSTMPRCAEANRFGEEQIVGRLVFLACSLIRVMHS
jgi:hypothetical protein